MSSAKIKARVVSPFQRLSDQASAEELGRFIQSMSSPPLTTRSSTHHCPNRLYGYSEKHDMVTLLDVIMKIIRVVCCQQGASIRRPLTSSFPLPDFGCHRSQHHDWLDSSSACSPDCCGLYLKNRAEYCRQLEFYASQITREQVRTDLSFLTLIRPQLTDDTDLDLEGQMFVSTVRHDQDQSADHPTTSIAYRWVPVHLKIVLFDLNTTLHWSSILKTVQTWQKTLPSTTTHPRRHRLLIFGREHDFTEHKHQSTIDQANRSLDERHLLIGHQTVHLLNVQWLIQAATNKTMILYNKDETDMFLKLFGVPIQSIRTMSVLTPEARLLGLTTDKNEQRLVKHDCLYRLINGPSDYVKQ